jgi:predicted transcriptional regulator
VKEVREEMAAEISNLIKEVKNKHGLEFISNKKIENYIQLSSICEEIKKQKEKAYEELNESERIEALHAFYKTEKLEIPEFLPVRDVAEFLGVTPQMVRRYCQDGKIVAHQRFEGSGQWNIPTQQFEKDPLWMEFIKEKIKMRENNIRTTELMLEMLSEEDEKDK